MKHTHMNAPLPFQGQKRRFARQIAEMAKTTPNKSIYVDLFGGSGLVSHIIKQNKPSARVIYNDYDNYTERLRNVSRTNEMLAELRTVLHGNTVKKRIEGSTRDVVLSIVKRYENSGYVDWITLSSNILFTLNYVFSIKELEKETLYNRVRISSYNASGYLEGVEVVREDYRSLFKKWKGVPEVLFILDPPYLSTDCTSYSAYWKLKDYLDVIKCLEDTSYVYFTSSKSSIVELAKWIERNPMRSPFAEAKRIDIPIKGAVNYTDIMLYKVAA